MLSLGSNILPLSLTPQYCGMCWTVRKRSLGSPMNEIGCDASHAVGAGQFGGKTGVFGSLPMVVSPAGTQKYLPKSTHTWSPSILLSAKSPRRSFFLGGGGERRRQLNFGASFTRNSQASTNKVFSVRHIMGAPKAIGRGYAAAESIHCCLFAHYTKFSGSKFPSLRLTVG